MLAMGPAARAAERVEFNRDVRPILSDKCLRCHGPDSSARQAELRLDDEANAKVDRGGYAAVVPGQVEASALIERITTEDATALMPPPESGKQLTAGEIATLRQWIAEGAAWELAWNYVPPRRAEAPEVVDKAWPINWIDRYVLARIEAAGLRPSAEADRTALLRRLAIDLTGLPPTPAEVEAFLADESPEAYERAVDRLLASPHYGERMAAYWLDLVRYADTVGYHGDQEHRIHPYRDWVIAALNANMPFDQFTHEQLAGDLLPQPTLAQRIATGYNRVLQTSHEGGVQPKEYMAIYAADHVRNLSIVWLGATLGCAQCHDHKYDPYTMRDFYSMEAFFADVDENRHLNRGEPSDTSPTRRRPEIEVLTPQQERELAGLVDAVQRAKGALAAAREAAGSEADAPAVAAAQQALDAAEKDERAFHESAVRTMVTEAIEPRPIRILPRGNWLDESGPLVEPAIPEFLGRLDVGSRRANRLDLARWLTDDGHGVGGLTARVMVNRLWYLAFGRGVSASLDDFGGQGQPPDDPALLDALAVEFIDSGWDVKHMLKLLAMSRAYRQSSLAPAAVREVDPANRLVARQGSWRYPAESVRDAALTISGLLVTRVGGPSAHPYQPAGYYKHLNFPEREYAADVDDNQWRRGVYTHWQRQFLHPMLKAFDAPSREECTVARPRSNTPLAALTLLNDPEFVEAARAFAVRILQQGGGATPQRLDFAFRWATSRPPTDEQILAISELLARSSEYYAEHRADAEALLAVGLATPPPELDAAELASWTVAARAMLNLQEVTTRE